jgi:erythromycin esterase
MILASGLLRLGGWTWRSSEAVNSEIDAELDFHIHCRTQELIDSGMSPNEAAAEAQRLFGAREQVRQQCRRVVYGSNLWLMVSMAAGMIVAAGVIVWLASRLNQLNQQNTAMQSMLAALQPAPEEKHDLTGTVTGANNKPVANARVVLIYKSWPGGRYTQQAFATNTDDDGVFLFKDLYSTSSATAFLVTVLADGYAMDSEYVKFDAKTRAKMFQFQLKPAIDKTLVLTGADGKPLAETVVWPGQRKPANGRDDIIIYEQSGPDAGYKTDKSGKVRMALFEEGDTVSLYVARDGSNEFLTFKADKSAEQSVGAAAKSTSGLSGTVADADGKPVEGARTLLILKSWPGGRYQQAPYETVTGTDGTYAFNVGNVADQQEAYLVTIAKDGLALQSNYVIKKKGDSIAGIDFQMKPAMKKVIVIRDAAGKPLAGTKIVPSKRVDADGGEHLIFPIAARSLMKPTDDAGRIEVPYFVSGDLASLMVVTATGLQELSFRVNDQPEQTADLGKAPKAAVPQRWTPPASEVDPAHVAWVKKNAIPFRLSSDASDDDFSDLQPLKEMIGNRRIVQLGEQTHGDGHCFEAKVRLIKFLHQEMGFDVLAFESGLYDCHRADAAFRSGVEPLTAAQLGVFPIWTGCRQTGPLWNYVAASAKANRPLEIAGFDCQFTGVASQNHFIDDLKAAVKEFTGRELSGADDEKFLSDLKLLISQARQKPSKTEFLARLDALITEVSTVSSDKSSADQSDAKVRNRQRWIQQLRSLRAYVAYTIPSGLQMSQYSSLNARDAQMADNLIWLAEKYHPDRKIIVWAATMHLTRSAAGIEVPDGFVDYSGVVPMGHLVHQKLGEQVFTVAFTAGGGTAGLWFQPSFEIGAAPAGTLEDICTKAGLTEAIVPLRSDSPDAAWLSEKLFARPLGYSWMKAVWPNHYDAVVFQKTMEPAVRIE